VLLACSRCSSPSQGDPAVIVSALRMVSELERMGDLSVHVAKIARLRVPQARGPRRRCARTVARMAEVARGHGRPRRQIITERDVEAAIVLGRDDDEMDMLRRTSFAQLLSDDWAHGVEAAVDIALLGPLLRAHRRPRRVRSATAWSSS
jgi:phosphate transport system protein